MEDEKKMKKKPVWMDRTGNHAWPPTVANHRRRDVRSADRCACVCDDLLGSVASTRCPVHGPFVLWENLPICLPAYLPTYLSETAHTGQNARDQTSFYFFAGGGSRERQNEIVVL